MSWEQLEEPHRAGSSQGLTQPPFMPGRIGETEAGTRSAGRCFPWADPAFWFHSSPPGWYHWTATSQGSSSALAKPFPPPVPQFPFFFQMLLPQQSLLLLSSGGRGRASPVRRGGCWPLLSGCEVGHVGGGKLWSPSPSLGPTTYVIGHQELLGAALRTGVQAWRERQRC